MISQEIKGIQSVSGHILRAVGRAFGKVLTSFLIFGVVGAGAIEGTSFATLSPHTFGDTLTHITAVAFGLVLGYAAGVTTAVAEAIRGLVDASKEATKEAENVGKAALGDVEKVGSGAEGVVGGIVHAVEGGVNKVEHKA